ncbi:TetR/AcrR family transcriptional regulator [Rathayibacter soli]|uniref:TetR/AcrR family transcriptional regulator n=1 Tax=Rathayibacter soli TaxID=3144168 RepID=UPI0027E4C681|nr:TetR/AcrR family transcriptional regulator [Glaciibacter superstes]
MPTPDRTSLGAIIRAGREILESQGIARLTMQAVAERVGVRAPSLYKRVRNREALIGLIAADAVEDLGEQLDEVASHSADARGRLRELAYAFRAFAHANPAGFRLIFAGSDATRPDPALLATAAAPLLRATRELAGPDEALEAARTLTAWASGFVSMELANGFRLGGDVERAFEFGATRLVDALAL